MSKNFIELFTDARAIGTPLVAIKTFDNASVRRAIKKSLGDAVASTPLISWDAINGLRGLTDEVGVPALAEMCNKANIDRDVTVDLGVALAACSFATEDHIIYVDNPHMFWEHDKKIVQGFWNLRDKYKANGNMVVILFGPGDTLPAELQQDTLILEEPLPTEAELSTIVTNTYKYAAQAKDDAGKLRYPACKVAPTADVIKQAVDAGIGLPTKSLASSISKRCGTANAPSSPSVPALVITTAARR
jgi:hypothetical protein